MFSFLFDNEMTPVADSQQLNSQLKLLLGTTCSVTFAEQCWLAFNLAAKFYINETLAAEVNDTANNIIFGYCTIWCFEDEDCPRSQHSSNSWRFICRRSLWWLPAYHVVLYYYFTPMVLNNAICSNNPPPSASRIQLDLLSVVSVSHNSRGNYRIPGSNWYFLLHIMVPQRPKLLTVY